MLDLKWHTNREVKALTFSYSFSGFTCAAYAVGVVVSSKELLWWKSKLLPRQLTWLGPVVQLHKITEWRQPSPTLNICWRACAENLTQKWKGLTADIKLKDIFTFMLTLLIFFPSAEKHVHMYVRVNAMITAVSYYYYNHYWFLFIKQLHHCNKFTQGEYFSHVFVEFQESAVLHPMVSKHVFLNDMIISLT